ncbi:hypothetical protein SLA2020_248340 [Shorea laevis]
MMELRGYSVCLNFFTIRCLVLLLSSSLGSVEAYKNYTVGGSLGWYDNTEKPVNYQKWADGLNFSLGDFLIFNSDNNHSIAQTYNFTTYKLCDSSDDMGNDTMEWSSDDPSATTPHGVSVAVPLVKEGMNYFFSTDYDGDQCEAGQHFQINVTHGRGLPKSLREPSDEAPAPNSPDFANADSAPDTIVPSNFDHPTDEETDDDKESSGSISLLVKSSDRKLFNGFVTLLGILSIF